MPKVLKIVQISAEVAPYSKTGGLADVARSLPKALHRLGHEVMIITPFYGQLIDPKKYKLRLLFSNVKVYLNSVDTVEVNYWQGYLMEGLPVYFVENAKYFSRSKKLYGSTHENVRFLVFDVAALKLLSLLKFKADIIQCHDWHTGLIPYFLKRDFRYSKTLKKAKTIYTIHNLAFQFGHNWWDVEVKDRDYGHKRIPHITDPQVENINFAKRAIFSADILNTVSEQYRSEIMTKNFGQDLHRILKNREARLFGIINGIDYNAYNPIKDKSLRRQYDYKKIVAKAENKKYIQKKFGLEVDLRAPLMCFTSRITWQKGLDLILRSIDNIMDLGIQFLIVGTGEEKYTKALAKAAKKYPQQLAFVPSHSQNQKFETLIYAGSDLFLLPSTYEPCGINQLIAMRYGCIPVVREVGGLYNTVTNFNPSTGQGTGFTFKSDNNLIFYGALVRAVENYKQREVWKKLVAKTMKVSSSWEIPAKKYIKLYRRALNL